MINTRLTLPSDAYADTYITDSEISYHECRKRPTVLTVPGGVYAVHTTKENELVATQFMQMGYQVFILKYSVGSDRPRPKEGIIKSAVYPLQAIGMLEVLHIVKEHASEWDIDKNRIFLMGFSADGHVCTSCGVRWNDPTIVKQLSFHPEKDELRAAGIVLGYPFLVPNSDEFFKKHPLKAVEKVQHIINYVLYQSDFPSQRDVEEMNLVNYISQDIMPMFLRHSTDNPVIDTGNSTRFISKLLEYGISAECRLFGHDKHGKTLENSLTHRGDEMVDHHLNSWISLTDHWMNRIGEE